MLDTDSQEPLRRFDNLMLQTQYTTCTKDSAAPMYTRQIQKLARGLQKQGNLPAVIERRALIDRVAADDFWKGTTLSQLEQVRVELRSLMGLLNKEIQPIIYTDFTDEISGESKEYGVLPGYISSEVYKERVEKIIRSNANHLTIRKLQHNESITEAEINELERMLFEAGEFDSKDSFEKTIGEKPLGVFIRSILGLDIQAAKAAFSEFMNKGYLTTTQSAFINTIIEYLNQNGTIDGKMLYKAPPFTEIDEEGISGVFEPEKAVHIIQIITQVNKNAMAS